jgi:hypothetical protein
VSERLLPRVARLLGGVVLMQGRLGHQILGQLLVARATELEIAGAQVAFAATAGQRNAVAQVAIRTALPTLAIRGLLRKDQNRLLRLRRMMLDRQAAAEATAAEATAGTEARLRSETARADREAAAATAARNEKAALEQENHQLSDQVATLRARLAALEEATRAPAPAPPPAAPAPAPPPPAPAPVPAAPAPVESCDPAPPPPAKLPPPLPHPKKRPRR